MLDQRELNIKPPCARELHGFPPQMMPLLWEKINDFYANITRNYYSPGCRLG